MTNYFVCIEIEIFILSLKAMLDRDYFYMFVHSLLYFECLSFPGFPCYVNSPLQFLEQESGKRCVKILKLTGFGFLTKCLLCSFCEKSVQTVLG